MTLEATDIPLKDGFKSGSGVSKFTSWRRLEEILRKAGELNDNELVSGYKVDTQGIAFYLENNDG